METRDQRGEKLSQEYLDKLVNPTNISENGRRGSKSVETVKSENFEQSSLTDESFSILNIHAPSVFGGAALVLVVLGLACLGYALAHVKDRRKEVARRAAITLEILKSPA